MNHLGPWELFVDLLPTNGERERSERRENPEKWTDIYTRGDALIDGEVVSEDSRTLSDSQALFSPADRRRRGRAAAWGEAASRGLENSLQFSRRHKGTIATVITKTIISPVLIEHACGR